MSNAEDAMIRPMPDPEEEKRIFRDRSDWSYEARSALISMVDKITNLESKRAPETKATPWAAIVGVAAAVGAVVAAIVAFIVTRIP